LQDTIFLGAVLSLMLYVGVSSKKFNLKQAVRLDDGGWQVKDMPKEMESNTVYAFVIQGLDFFAEIPTLADSLPPTRNVKKSVVILVIRDLRFLSSTGIKWLEKYVKDLKEGNNHLILADVNPEVVKTLRNSGALSMIGENNIYPATDRVLEADIRAWDAAQEWLKSQQG
jgi:SulP family sulfate permease